MFTPSHTEVRRFFCRAWALRQSGAPMQALEALAAGWAAEHPDSWRVHRLRTVNNFDVLEHPWWLAF